MKPMIIVTGAAGFIGSQIARHLAEQPTPLVLVDKEKALKETVYLRGLLNNATFISAERLRETLKAEASRAEALKAEFRDVRMIIHMGAITNTAEQNLDELKKWNVDYTKMLWDFCAERGVDFIYASSAATYGSGSQGFGDDHRVITHLRPLNPYGRSKQDFDLMALSETKTPPRWYGLKFFNVYGPHEGHKGRMASAVWHGYNEITKTGKMTLFRSHNPDVKDGDQARDFIYVGDVLAIVDFLMTKKPMSGIYNCGSGHAGTFMELAQTLFKELGKPMKINWVETPEEFRKAYQYRTQAEMKKLVAAGYDRPMTSLSQGIREYLKYLTTQPA